eukprot:SAG31_NODE_323_length_17713_cov_12.065834_10_plen_147_part_00
MALRALKVLLMFSTIPTAWGRAGSYWSSKQPLFNATYKELYNHSSANCSALGGSICYSDIDIVGDEIPPHGSRLFRLTAAPSLWIPNDGTATKSIVLNSSGFYPGNEPWKLVDGVWDSATNPEFQIRTGSKSLSWLFGYLFSMRDV